MYPGAPDYCNDGWINRDCIYSTVCMCDNGWTSVSIGGHGTWLDGRPGGLEELEIAGQAVSCDSATSFSGTPSVGDIEFDTMCDNVPSLFNVSNISPGLVGTVSLGATTPGGHTRVQFSNASWFDINALFCPGGHTQVRILGADLTWLP